MASEDIETVARMLPFELGPYPLRVRQQRLEQALPDAFVVLRSEKIVGACWFLDAVTPQQRWFGAIKDHLIPPPDIQTESLPCLARRPRPGFLLVTQATALLSAA
jgi:hypothetical protein